MPLSTLESIRSTLTLEAACDDAPYGVLVADANLTVRYVNRIACRLVGLTADALVGHALYDALPYLKDSTYEVVTTPIQTGTVTHIYEFAAPMPGREADGLLYWDATYSPVRAGEQIVGVMAQFMDVTQRVKSRQAEQQARQAEHERAAELDAVFNTLTDGIAIINAEGQIARVNPAGERILRMPLPPQMPISQTSDYFAARYPDTALPLPPEDMASARVLRGETVLAQEQLLRDGTGTDIILSVNAAPLREPGTGTVRGGVALFRDITNVKRLEAETAAAHARARRIAQTLQASLLPESPLSLDSMSMGMAFEAAWVEEADVGGDLLDYFFTGSTQAHLVIADVSGKGLLAARRTALIKYTVRALALSGMDMSHIVYALNAALLGETDFEGFVTFFYAVLDTSTHALQYVNAGHEPGLLWDGDTPSVRLLGPTGMPAGILRAEEGGAWTVAETVLRPSDALLVYTDGFTEAPEIGKSRRLLGEAQAQTLFQEALHLPDGPMAVNYILSAIHAHAGPRLRDDLALLLLRGNGVPVR